MLASQYKPVFPEGKIPVTLTFCPPDKRKRDDDNFVGLFKAGRDGVAEAWGIDDNRFQITIKVGEPVRGGQVIFEVEDTLENTSRRVYKIEDTHTARKTGEDTA